MGMPACGAALAEVHNAAVIVLGISGLDNALTRPGYWSRPTLDAIGAFNGNVRHVPKGDHFHIISSANRRLLRSVEGLCAPPPSRRQSFGGEVRGELQGQSLMARQSLAFLVHFERPLLQPRNNRSDLVQVEVGGDPRVTGALDHGAKPSVLELLECPLKRIIDDRRVKVEPVVLVARTIVVVRVIPEAVERQKLGFLNVRLAS